MGWGGSQAEGGGRSPGAIGGLPNVRASREALRVCVGKGEKKWEKGRTTGRRGKRGIGGGRRRPRASAWVPAERRAGAGLQNALYWRCD